MKLLSTLYGLFKGQSMLPNEIKLINAVKTLIPAVQNEIMHCYSPESIVFRCKLFVFFVFSVNMVTVLQFKKRDKDRIHCNAEIVTELV